MDRRALGNADPVLETDVWKNVARNLSRLPKKELATDLVDRADQMHTGTVRSLATAFQPSQQRQAEGQGATTFHRSYAAAQDFKTTDGTAPAMAQAAATNATETANAVRRIAGPSKRLETQAARRSTRNPAARPKHQPQTHPKPPMSQTEIKAEFTDALRNAGLRPPGEPVMDGQLHRVPVEGDRGRARSGAYRGCEGFSAASYVKGQRVWDDGKQMIPVVIG